MEIIDRGDDPEADMVQVAFTDTREEAALVRGLLREVKIPSIARRMAVEGPAIGAGILTRSPRRIYVRPGDAVAARRMLGETMVEEPPEEIPESANARYLADAGLGDAKDSTGRRPRDYSIIGAYARASLVAVVVLGLALLVFVVLH